MTKANEPAFPVNNLDSEAQNRFIYTGMSLRTYLAGQAMMGLLVTEGDGFPDEGNIARFAVKCADALINELNKTEK